MGALPYSDAETKLLLSGATYEEFNNVFPGRRTRDAWRNRRQFLGIAGKGVDAPDDMVAVENAIAKRAARTHTENSAITWNKKTGDFNWREMVGHITGLQQIRHESSWSQDEADIRIDTDEPICVVTLSDTHLGAWSSDHELFVRITDEIINTPNLYVVLLGDLLNLAIKLRGVGEVKDDLLPPELQHLFLEQWLEEISPKLLMSTWDNHGVEREETQAGSSVTARLLSRKTVYFSGIGHADILVGEQTYKFAVSHHFMGRSMYNPVHGAQRYLIQEGHEREIAMCGDSHVPGLLVFRHGGTLKVAVNAGTTQLNSRYAKRYFSLISNPDFPCVVLDPHEHRVTPYWSVSHWAGSNLVSTT